MGFSKGKTPGPWETEETSTTTPPVVVVGGGGGSYFTPPEVTTTTTVGGANNNEINETSQSPPPSNNSNVFSSRLREVKQGEYNELVANELSYISGWSYSDFETFKDMLSDKIGPNTDVIEIQVKNEPLLVEATAQIIRTSDKKVMVIAFRGTEVSNPVNWVTDAIAKKSDFCNDVNKTPSSPSSASNRNGNKPIRVHTGFKTNWETCWFGQKGILMHLLIPDMMNIDYDYSKLPGSSEQPPTCRNNEQELLEAIYICGHSLGGAMAFLAGLWLGLQQQQQQQQSSQSQDDDGDIGDDTTTATTTTTASWSPVSSLFSKLRGIYTYGAPMAVDNHNRDVLQNLVGHINFRHVYYNDIVPHLPPLSSGGYDHVGIEYRYHPRDGWKQLQDNERCTQVPSILFTGFFGFIDGILDQINWLNFVRGEDHDVPFVGCFSRGYLKMWWSFPDHGPAGYINSLKMKLLEQQKTIGSAITNNTTTNKGPPELLQHHEGEEEKEERRQQ